MHWIYEEIGQLCLSALFVWCVSVEHLWPHQRALHFWVSPEQLQQVGSDQERYRRRCSFLSWKWRCLVHGEQLADVHPVPKCNQRLRLWWWSLPGLGENAEQFGYLAWHLLHERCLLERVFDSCDYHRSGFVSEVSGNDLDQYCHPGNRKCTVEDMIKVKWKNTLILFSLIMLYANATAIVFGVDQKVILPFTDSTLLICV